MAVRPPVASASSSLRGAKRRGSPDFVEVAIGVVFDWIAARPPVARKDAEWVFLLHWIAFFMPRLALVAWQFSSLVVSAFLLLRGVKRCGSPASRCFRTLVTARREALWQSSLLLPPHPRHCEARSAVAVQTLLKLQSALFLTGLPRALRSLAKTRNRSCCFTGLPHSLRSLAKTRLEAWGSNFITARLLARAQSHLNMHPLLARKGNAQKGAP